MISRSLLVVAIGGLTAFALGCDADAETGPEADGAGGSGVSEPNERLVEGQVVFLHNGRSAPVEFVAPDDVLSLSVTVVGEPGSEFRICEWTSEDGFVLVPSAWEDLDSVINPVRPDETVLTAFAPNSSASRVTPGAHTLTVCGERVVTSPVSPVRLYVTAKRGDAEPSSGVLDLNLLFTGAEGWTAETAPNDPELQSDLSRLDEILEQAGITLGTITYADLGPNNAIVHESELPSVFEAIDPILPLAVNVAFFESVETPEGSGFYGVSSGVPGPYVRDTPSGVTLSMSTIRKRNKDRVRILAHEIGHYLGLFHSTDTFGRTDFLDDTATGDTTNLMYFDPEGSTLSPEQGRVLRLSPFVR